MTAAALPLLPKSWVQLPLFDGLDRARDVPRGVVVSISGAPNREPDAILRLVMSLKPPMPPSANAPEIGPAPDPQLFVHRGVELRVHGAKRKPRRSDAAIDKAVAADPKTPK